MAGLITERPARARHLIGRAPGATTTTGARARARTIDLVTGDEATITDRCLWLDHLGLRGLDDRQGLASELESLPDGASLHFLTATPAQSAGVAEACAQRAVTWQWVKGHSGHPGNSRADKLARDGLLGRIIGHSGEPQAPRSDTPAPHDGTTLVRVYIARRWTARRGRVGARHGRGAWAAIIEDGTGSATIDGVDDDTTKQRLELNAAVEALRRIDAARNVEVHTCSRYLEDGITLWLESWIRQDWYRGAGGRIKNHDLWSALATERDRLSVHWQWHQAEAAGPGCGRAAEIAHRALGDTSAG